MAVQPGASLEPVLTTSGTERGESPVSTVRGAPERVGTPGVCANFCHILLPFPFHACFGEPCDCVNIVRTEALY